MPERRRKSKGGACGDSDLDICLGAFLAAVLVLLAACLVYIGMRLYNIEHPQVGKPERVQRPRWRWSPFPGNVAGLKTTTENIPRSSTSTLTSTSVGITTAMGSVRSSSTRGQQTTKLPDYAQGLTFRLPDDLVPHVYYLRLRSYLPSPGGVVTYAPEKNFTFDGYVEIAMVARKSTQRLVLNSDGLDFSESSFELFKVTGDALIDYIELAEKPLILHRQQMVVFALSNPMEKGQLYNFQIAFTGKLQDDMAGYYKSSYMEKGQTRWMAMTQFEAMDARKAFPCFDEPSFKATFWLTMEHPHDLVAIGNSPVLSQKSLGNGWMVTEFNASPRMSSYLLAFVLAAFNETKSATADNSVQFGAWSRPDEINRTTYASEIGPKILTFYEEMFEMKYPLSKTDQVAVPAFAAGAMENWGLITYRERALLYSPTVNSLADKAYVTSVVAHELAHQWFGNLVTMKWWDDIWLNEGFASYLEYLSGEFVNPGSHFIERFSILEVDRAMETDQHQTAHPMTAPVNSNQDASNMFDIISYQKGASILNMLRYTLGPELFRKCLAKVLEEGSLKWWDGETFDVKTFMDTWVMQPGFPIVSVTRIKSSHNRVTIGIRQERFTLSENRTHNRSVGVIGGTLYYLPLHYKTQKNSLVWLKWLHTAYDTITLRLAKHEWFVINLDGHGYYRVNYDDQNWANLQRQLITDHTAFSVRTRTKIMSDVLKLAWVDKVQYPIALSMFLYLKKEKNNVPWTAARKHINDMRSLLKTHPEYDTVRNFFLSLVKKHYDRLGWNGKDVNQSDYLEERFFTKTITSACWLGHRSCQKQALNKFKEIVALCPSSATICQPKIRAEFLEMVYCLGARKGNKDTFEYLWQRFQKASNSEERGRLLLGLSCVSSDSLRKRLIRIALDGKTVTLEVTKNIISWISAEQGGPDIVLDSMSNDWKSYMKRFNASKPAMRTFRKIISAVAKKIATDNHAHQLDGIIAAHKMDLGPSYNAFKDAVETARKNIDWRKQNADEIVNWIKNI